MGADQQTQNKEPQTDINEFMQSANYQQRLNQVYNPRNQAPLGVPNSEIDDYMFMHPQVNFGAPQMQGSYASVQQATMLPQRSEMFIMKTTFKMVRDQMASNIYRLQFMYTARQAGKVEIYFVATENQENGSINSLARSTSFIQPGENVEYADTGAMLNTSLLARAEVEKVHSDHVEWKYSVIVKIGTIDQSWEFTHFCRLKFTNSGLDVHCVVSRLKNNGQVMILQDVFGIHDSVVGEKSESEKEPCKVCLTSQINTMIKPCLHTVLCQECCEGMRARKQRCPICRSQIVEFVLINRVETQLNQQPQTQAQQGSQRQFGNAQGDSQNQSQGQPQQAGQWQEGNYPQLQQWGQGQNNGQVGQQYFTGQGHQIG